MTKSSDISHKVKCLQKRINMIDSLTHTVTPINDNLIITRSLKKKKIVSYISRHFQAPQKKL